ncbi:hypothetical protein GQ53DRAFT_818413 [Thozetella sp. PMI_491]|nr:hypothetical protein GQ53DRAFT_818413 [Thozetella sp. PMI_491]
MNFFRKSQGRLVYSPLAASTEVEEGGISKDNARLNRPGWNKNDKAFSLVGIINGIIALLNVSAAFYLFYTRSRYLANARLPEGLQDVRIFDGFYIDEIDRYFGEPGQEIQENWKGLLEYETLQVPADLLQEGQIKNAIQLPDGGYLASLWMHHDLRCLVRQPTHFSMSPRKFLTWQLAKKSLHHLLYMEHYSPNITDKGLRLFRLHTGHCLDALRQSTVCRGDTSLLVMQWSETQKRPLVTPASYSDHSCANWESLREWRKSHAYDVLAPGALVHPTLGPSFSEDDHHGTGLVMWSKEELESLG